MSGADYRKSQKSIIAGVCFDTIAANLTRYLGPYGSDDFNVTNAVQFPISVAGVIYHLYYQASGDAGAGETFDCTLIVNGAPTALTCQIAGAGPIEATDLVNEIAVVPGDDICIEIITSLNAAARLHKWCMTLKT